MSVERGVSVAGRGVSVAGTGVSVGTSVLVGKGVSLGIGEGVGVSVAVNRGRGVLVGVGVMRDRPPPPREQLMSRIENRTIRLHSNRIRLRIGDYPPMKAL
jgi:hypothetical protein